MYARAFSDEWAARVASVAPFPAAFVSGRPVWLGNFLFEYKGMRTYYNQNASGALTEEDDASLRKNVLDALVRRVIVNRIALDESVYLTEEAVESAQAGMIPSDTPAEKLAEDSGYDIAKLQECVLNKDTGDAVIKQIEQAQTTGIYGTPTIFINGKALVGPKPYRVYERTLKN